MYVSMNNINISNPGPKPNKQRKRRTINPKAISIIQPKNLNQYFDLYDDVH